MGEQRTASMDQLLAQLARVPEMAQRALATWGADVQLSKAQEEMGELQTAIARFVQGCEGHRPGRVRPEDLAEEAADVILTALQVGLIATGRVGMRDALAAKLDKLARILEEAPDAA